MTTFCEDTVLFDCDGERLLGIVSRPDERSSDSSLGVVIVVGGPQYRIGSHRQFVLWARALAAAGTPTLRFDARGMGDSSGAPRRFTELDVDIAAAIRALLGCCPGVRKVVLCGLCDGASAALLYLQRQRDTRVGGLLLLNPWVRSETSHARTLLRHYYGARLRSRAFWTKLLRGGVALPALREGLATLRRAGPGATPVPAAMGYQAQMAAALHATSCPVLLVLSGDDYTAREFLDHCAADAQWHGVLERPGLQRVDVGAADHTFSSTQHRLALEAASQRWIATLRHDAAVAAGS